MPFKWSKKELDPGDMRDSNDGYWKMRSGE